MPSEVDICNLALMRVKSTAFLSSLSDTGKMETEARLCALLYPMVRDAVLESLPWDFATRRATLVLFGAEGSGYETENPGSTTNWEFRYEVPSDFIKARSIVGYRNPNEDQLIPFEVISEEVTVLT